MKKNIWFALVFIALGTGADGRIALAATSGTSCLTGKATVGTIAKMTCDSFKNCQGAVTWNYTAPCIGTRDGVPDQTVCQTPSISGQTDPEGCSANVFKNGNNTTTSCSPHATGHSSGKCACSLGLKSCAIGLAS